jgi:hypothetical protein
MAYPKKSKGKKSPNQAVALPQDRGSVTDDEHAKLVTWVNEADDATVDSRTLSEKSRNYYDSKQWTDTEVAKLAKQKQAATVVNRCKPKIDALMGMEHANRTTAKAFPRTPKHTEGATAATEAVRFCLQDNMYERHRSDTWENMTIEGTGGIEVNVEPKGESFKITIKHMMWDRLIYDPHSRRKDFSDARYLGQVVWMDYDEAVAMYPGAEDVLEEMQAGSETYDDKPRWMDNTRRRVKIVELYYKKDKGDWCYACFTRGGYLKEPKVSPFKNEEGETEHAYEFASLFVDRDGGRYGALRQILDIQDEINKRRSKALHLMSVRQVRWERGAVEDINKARDELAKPDGVLETTPGMEFEILKTGDMAAAQFNLLTEAKMEMDLIGANAATQGKDKTVQSGVALRQRVMTGQTELAPMFDMLKNLDIRVYRKVWNRIKQYWKSEMWLRVTDDENNLKFVGLNKPMTQGETLLKQAQEQGAPPEALAQLQAEIAQNPMMQKVVSTENDIVNLDVDIVMDDAPDTVTQEVEDFQAMAEMVKSGFPLPPEAVIMSSPLSNKDKIIKMMKEQPQMSPQHQEQMKKMQEEFQKLQEENQQLKANTETDMVKIAADAEADKAKAALKKQQLDDEYALKKEAQDREAQLARDKAIDEFNLKKDIAEKEYALEKEMCDKKSALEKEKAEGEMEHKAADLVMTKDHEMKKLDIEKEKLAISEKDKQSVKSEAEAKSIAPQLLQAMKQMMETQNKFNENLITEMKKPKTITAKSSSGATITATTH